MCLRVFVRYVSSCLTCLRPSCLTCLTYAYSLSVLCALCTRLSILLEGLKIFSGWICSPSSFYSQGLLKALQTVLFLCGSKKKLFKWGNFSRILFSLHLFNHKEIHFLKWNNKKSPPTKEKKNVSFLISPKCIANTLLIQNLSDLWKTCCFYCQSNNYG